MESGQVVKEEIFSRIRADDPTLTSVYMEEVTARDVDRFIEAMQGNTHVIAINIRGLPRAKTLEESIARGAPINDESAIKLAHLIGSNHRITEICMDENNIGLKGATAFFKALKDNPNIVSFSPVCGGVAPDKRIHLQNALRTSLILKGSEYTGDPAQAPDDLILDSGSKNIVNLDKLSSGAPDLQKKCMLNEAAARNLIYILINQNVLDADKEHGNALLEKSTVKSVMRNNLKFRTLCQKKGISIMQEPEDWLLEQSLGHQNIEGLALEIQERLPAIIYVAETRLGIARQELARMLLEMQKRAEAAEVEIILPEYIVSAGEQTSQPENHSLLDLRKGGPDRTRQ